MIDVPRDDGRGRQTYSTRREPGDARPSYWPEDIAARERAVLLGTRQGRTVREISHQVGITMRQVTRIRTRLRARGEL